jgi:alpha-D-xyloside xylohydrolase
MAGTPHDLRAASERRESVVSAEFMSHEQGTVRLAGRTGGGFDVSITLSIVAADIARVLLETPQSERDRFRLARPLEARPAVRVERDRDDRVVLAADGVRLSVHLDPFHIGFSKADGTVVLDQNRTSALADGTLLALPFGFTPAGEAILAFHDTFSVAPDEHFFGFGEQFTNFDKRGQRVDMWVSNALGATRAQAYKPVPFFVSTRNYGLFVDSLARTTFDMATSDHSTFYFTVPDEALDYYVIVGDRPADVVRGYCSLVGFPPVLPKWTFGTWISSSFQPDDARSLVERARRLRTEEIPADVLHVDPYWQASGSGENPTWDALAWNGDAFPDPERTIAELRELDFKLCVWISPYLSVRSPHFAHADREGYFLKHPNGDTYLVDAWHGYQPLVGILDFTNPAMCAWFGGLLRPLLRSSVDVFKTDFGEAVPEDAVASNGMSDERLHNLYPLLYNDVVVRFTAEETRRPPVVWARSSFAGGQRHAGQWAGDPESTYAGLASVLRSGLSLGLCGHCFWGHDIGGTFATEPDGSTGGNPPTDLYIRWAQFGLLSPLARAHGLTTRLPWDYGAEALAIFRKYARLRYRLMPYIYSYALSASKTGLPLLRPMMLEFPDDPAARTVDLQFMLGAELLIAPLYDESGRRSIYLPPGAWVDFWTREVTPGGQFVEVDAPLDVLPIFVREDAVIPTIEPKHYVAEESFTFVTFDGYVRTRGEFALHDVDGTTTIAGSLEDRTLALDATGPKQRICFRLIPLQGVAVPDEVVVNGARVREAKGDLWTSAAGGWTLEHDHVVRVVVVKGMGL